LELTAQQFFNNCGSTAKGIMKQALIIFAKKPEPGMVKTRLSPPLSAEQAAEFYGCMLLDTLAQAARVPEFVDRFLFHDAHGSRGYFEEVAEGMEVRTQKGNDLGERMEHAFREVFSRGYGAAAIIGTDSPHLPPAYLEMAFALFKQGEEAVFGPASDGGYYLVGLTKPSPELFYGIEWSSANVLEQSLERASAQRLTVSLLPPWHDIDTAEDLNRPELLDPANGADLTRRFILALRAGSRLPALTTP
jgi:rSAM/selenodomain-associated transferase 1